MTLFALALAKWIVGGVGFGLFVWAFAYDGETMPKRTMRVWICTAIFAVLAAAWVLATDGDAEYPLDTICQNAAPGSFWWIYYFCWL